MRFARSWSFVLLGFVASLPLLTAADMKPEELVARHLASIGTAEARAAIQRRAVRGNVSMNVLLGGKGTLEGPGMLLSEGRKLKYLMKFDSDYYPGEEFTYNGEGTFTATYQPGLRSKLAAFILAQNDILKEGLLGGTLSTAWALLDVPGRNPKLSYDGIKKADGRNLHQLTYRARKGSSDLTVRLYFEPETFRHVYSVYAITLGAPMALAERESGGQQVTRVTLEETFSDFASVDGLNLPATWKMKFTTETDRTVILECFFRASKIENNVSLGEDAFRPVGLVPRN